MVQRFKFGPYAYQKTKKYMVYMEMPGRPIKIWAYDKTSTGLSEQSQVWVQHHDWI